MSIRGSYIPSKKSRRKDTRPEYRLDLFVADCTPRSRIAIHSVTELCEKKLKGHYSLNIIDMYKHPDRVRKEQILAAPTLLVKSPFSRLKIIGDLSKPEQILSKLGLAKI